MITLDALTRREWVKEDELAAQIKVHPKVLRRAMRYLEQVLPPPGMPSLLADMQATVQAVAPASFQLISSI